MQHFIICMAFMYKIEMKFFLAITLLFFSFVLSKEVSVPQWEDLECEVKISVTRPVFRKLMIALSL